MQSECWYCQSYEAFPDSAFGKRLYSSEAESSGFFGKSVMSNDVLLGHTGKRMNYVQKE